jgi:hypothetical protein
MLVFLPSLLYEVVGPPHVDRRWKDDPSYHDRTDALENRVGSPTPTGRDDGGVPRGWLHLLA